MERIKSLFDQHVNSRVKYEDFSEKTHPWTEAEQKSIVQSFGFDEEAYADYFGEYTGRCMVCLSTCWFPTYCCNWACAPLFLKWEKQNAKELSQLRYLALSNEGIMYCEKAHKQSCRLRCNDVAEVKTFIPYDTIFDAWVVSPSDSKAVLSKETLYRVEIHTTKGGPELTIWGLIDPVDFACRVKNRAAGLETPEQMSMSTNEWD